MTSLGLKSASGTRRSWPQKLGTVALKSTQTNFHPFWRIGANAQVGGAGADRSKTGNGHTRSRREKPLPTATPFVWRTLKRREWLHANHYIRGFVSATIAPGGVGKSTNAIVEALAMVTGLPLPHRPAFRIAAGKQLRVWYVNGEDPIEETERRFQAAMLHFGIKPEDVEGRLFIDSGHDQDFVFARENGKVVTVVELVVDSVMTGIKEKGIDCLILGSGLIDQSQNMTAAAMQIAEK